MMWAKKSLVVFMLMIVSLSFFACDNSSLPELSCSGTVTIDNLALEDVTIKSNVKNYATTSSSGEYSFTTKSNKITIYPEKDGYIFSPESITIEAGQNNNVNFVAEPIVNLRGKIKLSKIIITPLVISQSPDNFEYVDANKGKKAVKAKDIYVWSINEPYIITNSVKYLYKQEENCIYVNKNLTFDTGESFSLGILINTYFTSRGYGESSTSLQSSNSNYTFLYVSKPQTNADLINNQIIYNLYGINNNLRTITYNVSFIFDYLN